MFGWFRRKSPIANAGERIVTQPHGEVFPWPKGAVLTAVDQLVLALPIAMIEKDRRLNELIFGPNEMEINIPPEGEVFFIRLTPGMSVSLAKSAQSYVVSEDKKPRRIKAQRPQLKT